jgi:hypothetical protein
MTNNDIYTSALAILAEGTSEGDNADYEERAPYLIAAFCTEAKDADSALRKALDEPMGAEFNAVFVPLEDDFPLLDRFSSAAALYLAAMLIIDDFPELSDKIYDKYSDAMSSICSSVPAVCESIQNRYFYD